MEWNFFGVFATPGSGIIESSGCSGEELKLYLWSKLVKNEIQMTFAMMYPGHCLFPMKLKVGIRYDTWKDLANFWTFPTSSKGQHFLAINNVIIGIQESVGSKYFGVSPQFLALVSNGHVQRTECVLRNIN